MPLNDGKFLTSLVCSSQYHDLHYNDREYHILEEDRQDATSPAGMALGIK